MAAPLISSISNSGPPPTAGQAQSTAGNVLVVPETTIFQGNGSVNDLFAQLKEFTWKGVSFPVTETNLEIRQDLVIHKFADRNGAYVEGTGRHPVQVTAIIPFLNQIYPSGIESWAAGTLYPYTWRAFVLACLEGTSGPLQHPELGKLNCKIENVKTDWKGNVRGGVWVHATWVESDDTQADQLGQDLSQDSPTANLNQSATDIDSQIATLDAAVALQQNPLPSLGTSFSTLASAIVGAVDQVTIFEKQFQGRTDNLLYQCNQVETSLMLSANASPMYWPILQNTARLKSAAALLQQQPAIADVGKVVKTFTSQKDSTMAQLAAQAGADVGQFMVLNAAFMGSPVVPAGSVLQYYATAA